MKPTPQIRQSVGAALLSLVPPVNATLYNTEYACIVKVALGVVY